MKDRNPTMEATLLLLLASLALGLGLERLRRLSRAAEVRQGGSPAGRVKRMGNRSLRRELDSWVAEVRRRERRRTRLAEAHAPRASLAGLDRDIDRGRATLALYLEEFQRRGAALG